MTPLLSPATATTAPEKPVAPAAADDDFSFADFDSAPDDALNNAVAAAACKLENTDTAAAVDPFGDNNTVDLLDASNSPDMVQVPTNLIDSSDLE